MIVAVNSWLDALLDGAFFGVSNQASEAKRAEEAEEDCWLLKVISLCEVKTMVSFGILNICIHVQQIQTTQHSNRRRDCIVSVEIPASGSEAPAH